jgi:hypothetical protein
VRVAARADNVNLQEGQLRRENNTSS